jgi:transposase-like protein
MALPRQPVTSGLNIGERQVPIKRRRRSAGEKREIAEASLKSGASVHAVAEAYGVHPSQVGKWRRSYRSGSLQKAPASALLAVRVSDDDTQGQPNRAAKSKTNQHGIIHIEFASARVSIEGTADGTTLRAVLECLAG